MVGLGTNDADNPKAFSAADEAAHITSKYEIYSQAHVAAVVDEAFKTSLTTPQHAWWVNLTIARAVGAGRAAGLFQRCDRER